MRATNKVWWGAGVLVASALLSFATVATIRLRAVPPAPSPLAPDPHAVRYQHATLVERFDETGAAIALLEGNPAPTALDLAELAELYLRRAKASGDPKDHAAADAMARRSLAILPSPNSAVLVLARLANARHDFATAIELARRHKGGRSPGASTVLATAHLALGELPAAAAAAEAVVLEQPGTAAYLMRALVMQAQGRDDEAAFDFARAATLEEPGDLEEAARLRALWGRFLLRRGELAGARLAIDEALRLAPTSALALAQRGELALRTGRAKEAIARFEDAFASSRQVRYLIDQARARELAGDRPGADALRTQVEHLVRADDLGHRLELVEVLVDRGSPSDLGEAVAIARDEVARRPSAETRFQLARALARAGTGREALVHIQAALALGAREAQLYELAARLEQQHGSSARATVYARRARELDPGDAGWRHAGLGPR